MSPHLRVINDGPNEGPFKFRVRATGQVMDAVARHGHMGHTAEYRTIAEELNVSVVSLADQDTGEIRTYLLSALERVEGDEGQTLS